MDALDNLLDHVKAQVSERIGSPLVAAFGAGWIAFNFRLLIVIVGEGDFDDKVKFIDNMAAYTLWTTEWLHRNLLYPAAFALLYVLLYPLASLAVGIYQASVKTFQLAREKRLAIGLLDIASKHDMRNLRDLCEQRAGELSQLQGQQRDANHAHVQLVDKLNSELKAAKQLTAEREAEIATAHARFGNPDDMEEGLTKEFIESLGLSEEQHRFMYAEPLRRKHVRFLGDADTPGHTLPAMTALNGEHVKYASFLMQRGLLAPIMAMDTPLVLTGAGKAIVEARRRANQERWLLSYSGGDSEKQ